MVFASQPRVVGVGSTTKVPHQGPEGRRHGWGSHKAYLFSRKISPAIEKINEYNYSFPEYRTDSVRNSFALPTPPLANPLTSHDPLRMHSFLPGISRPYLLSPLLPADPGRSGSYPRQDDSCVVGRSIMAEFVYSLRELQRSLSRRYDSAEVTEQAR
jgi:hypothetical protein